LDVSIKQQQRQQGIQLPVLHTVLSFAVLVIFPLLSCLGIIPPSDLFHFYHCLYTTESLSLM